ncbi:hypothetical protein GSI_04788 [Ganoderma sinense ZZ0214-1]|uniref:Uncharacterized protein n=1 Tax=Ganoderma sinense ZZ0214-1 TaxID=1077348 RepID=A0A2G8SHZ0_9APHY|nr:hypothetical protein GSI_04788 [Ganoderma sinense ZZ0214-1]
MPASKFARSRAERPSRTPSNTLDEHPAQRFPLSRILANEVQANFISIASRGHTPCISETPQDVVNPNRKHENPAYECCSVLDSRQGSRQVSLLDPDASPTTAHGKTDSGVHKHRRVCACALEPWSAWLAAR